MIRLLSQAKFALLETMMSKGETDMRDMLVLIARLFYRSEGGLQSFTLIVMTFLVLSFIIIMTKGEVIFGYLQYFFGN